MFVNAAAYTTKGRVRPRNEDSFLLAAYTGGGSANPEGATACEFRGEVRAARFFLVADGMGGHAAGDAASAFVACSVRDAAGDLFDAPSIEALAKDIHAALAETGRLRGTPNMGSTLSGIVLQEGAPSGVFNAGDSRVYRLRDGELRQLTQDDSLASMVPGAAKNIITNALGAGLAETSVACDFSPGLALPGDVFFLCSDGVHAFTDPAFLASALAAPEPPSSIAKRITDHALASQSDDNCTALVLAILPPEKEP
jgi:serine/threonine protein phosphatase PrpC